MKNFFIFFAIILFANPAFSQNSGFEGFSLELIIPDESSNSDTLIEDLSEEQICENESYPGIDKFNCFLIVERKSLLIENESSNSDTLIGGLSQESKEQICENYDGISKLSCFLITEGKNLSSKKTEICENRHYDSDQIECLKDFAKLRSIPLSNFPLENSQEEDL